jgi:hypothetical protein
MNFRITFSRQLLLVVMGTALMLTACAAPASVVKTPPTPPPPAVPQPEIKDIVGIREWHPNVESSLICAAVDPDGNPLTFTWTAEKGIIKGEGQKVSWVPPGEIGEYEITVKVTNAKGGEASFSKRFSVVNPTPPEPDKTIYLKLSIPSTNLVSAQGRIRSFFTAEIQCDVEGRDPAELTYIWSAQGGKLDGIGINEGKASRVGWIAPQGGKDQYKVFVLVADKAGNQAAGEVNFEVLCCRDP